MDIPQGYKKTDLGVIPDDWDVKEFEKVLKVIDGDRGDNYPSNDDLYESEYCLFLSAKNVTKEGFKFSECIFITKGKDDLLGKGKLIKKDIVLTTRGTVGNIAFFDDSVPFENIRINSGMVILRNEDKNLENIYLYSFLKSHLFPNQVDRVVFGSAQPQLTVKGINKFQIPLPPLAEQKAIAQSLSDVDALITAIDQLITKKRNIKQGTMQQLLTGKKRLPGFSGDWEVKTFKECFEFLSTGTNSRSELSEYGTIGYIHYGDIHTQWNLVLDCAKNNIPLIDKEKVNKLPILKDGDLILADASEDYEGIGISVEIKNIGDRKIVAGLHTLLMRGNKQILADGFKAFITSITSVRQSLQKMATGISVYGISKTNLKAIQILLPPTLEEQKAIAQILSDMDAEIESLEKKREKYKTLKQGMMQELLTGKTRLKHKLDN
jgi:type I restriction enzyme, S subunit